MRKVVVFGLAAAMAATLAAAPAWAHPTQRHHHHRPLVVTDGYTSPSGVVVTDLLGVPYLGSPVFANRVDLEPRRYDDHMTLTVADLSGTTVGGAIVQHDRYVGSFCGATDKALPIHGGARVTVYLWAGTCPHDPATLSIVTSGEVTARFTDRR